MVISHDRWFLDRIATHILAFEGDSQANFFEGNYSEYEADRKKRLGKDFVQPGCGIKNSRPSYNQSPAADKASDNWLTALSSMPLIGCLG